MKAPQDGHWKSAYSTIVTGALGSPRTGAAYAPDQDEGGADRLALMAELADA